jgi:hypothetical protein
MNPQLTTYTLDCVGGLSAMRVSQALASEPQFKVQHFDSGNTLWISLFDQPNSICVLPLDPTPAFSMQWVSLVRDAPELDGVTIILTCPGEQFSALKAETARLKGCYLVPENMDAKDMALVVERAALRHQIQHTARTRNEPNTSVFTPSQFRPSNSSAYMDTVPVALSH